MTSLIKSQLVAIEYLATAKQNSKELWHQVLLAQGPALVKAIVNCVHNCMHNKDLHRCQALLSKPWANRLTSKTLSLEDKARLILIRRFEVKKVLRVCLPILTQLLR